jgi:hypothetical protein
MTTVILDDTVWRNGYASKGTGDEVVMAAIVVSIHRVVVMATIVFCGMLTTMLGTRAYDGSCAGLVAML